VYLDAERTLILKFRRFPKFPIFVVGEKNSDGLELGIYCPDSLSLPMVAQS
jgi:hypothetical protein